MLVASILTAVALSTAPAVSNYAAHLEASTARWEGQAHQAWHEEQERKQPVMANQAMWEAIAECESGGDWSINTGNSFYGGLQFNKMSWDWAGGEKYAAYPHQATKAQQIDVANELLRIHPAGLGAWPACTKKLGLR